MKPSEQYKEIAEGRLMLIGADKAVQSWFRLHIFIKACALCEIPGIEERRAMINQCPKTYSAEFKLEVLRVWPIISRNT